MRREMQRLWYVGGTVGIAGIVSLLLTGCGEPSASRSITVIATEMQFTPQTIQAVQGEFVTVQLENKGQLAHNLILELATGVRTAAAERGGTASTTFPVPNVGNYRFLCTIPGHEAMVGELIVDAKE